MYKKIALSAALCTTLLSQPLCAQTDFLGNVTGAQPPNLSKRIDKASQNAFERGSYQVLRAVEKALQTRYEYGLAQSAARMPIMRLPLPGGANPRAKKPTAETPSQIVRTLLADLDAARATLDEAEAQGAQPFELAVADLWFDIDSNDKRGAREGVMDILGSSVFGRRALTSPAADRLFRSPPTIRFDEADLAWLTAYAHMLSGLAETYLAYDPAPVWADLEMSRAALPNVPELAPYYDRDALAARLESLEAQLEELGAEHDQLREKHGELRRAFNDQLQKLRAAPAAGATDADIAALQAELDTLEEARNEHGRAYAAAGRSLGLLRTEIRAIEQTLPDKRRPARDLSQFAPQIDLVYVLIEALAQEPDAARISRAFAHWRAMVAHNRIFWSRVEAETDNEREWIPNPRQTSALGFEIEPDTMRIWQEILAEGEALLEGRLLVPHPLLPQGHGISLKRFEQNPSPLDLVALVHGRGLYPFVAKGDVMNALNWRRFARLTGGNAGGFALWFN